MLVIDEFPYLVKTNPDFPSLLQNAWDEVLKDHNVMLIPVSYTHLDVYKRQTVYTSVVAFRLSVGDLTALV